MAAGFIFYILAGLFLAFSFKRQGIAVAVAVLICFNLITVTLLGFVLFKEVLGLKEALGLGLALVVIILLNL